MLLPLTGYVKVCSKHAASRSLKAAARHDVKRRYCSISKNAPRHNRVWTAKTEVNLWHQHVSVFCKLALKINFVKRFSEFFSRFTNRSVSCAKIGLEMLGLLRELTRVFWHFPKNSRFGKIAMSMQYTTYEDTQTFSAQIRPQFTEILVSLKGASSVPQKKR